MFGGMPLYTSTKEDVKARATDVETFHFIDSLLDVSMPNLPLKETLGAPRDERYPSCCGCGFEGSFVFQR